MSKVLYHLHIDAAHIPESLLNWATQEAGFHYDDFPHHFQIEGKNVQARHLTKYIMEPATASDVKMECFNIQNKSQDMDLQGFIQAEYIMSELEWDGKKTALAPIPTPFHISMRALNPALGEQFKKHELHLELNKQQTSEAIVAALKGCGFHVLDNPRDVTFTCSGHPKQLTLIKEKLEEFLNSHSQNASGKMVYEATAFWSLHNLGPEHLPHIVHEVN